MPELPEVETTIRDLRKKVLNRTFFDVWTDWKKVIKRPKLSTRAKLDAGLVPHLNEVSGAGDFKEFQKKIKGKKIKKIWRRGKNIIFELSQGYSLLIHQKLTGHLLYGKWNVEHGIWVAQDDNALKEKVNTYIHLMFFLDNGKMLAFSDLRKFAKVELWKTEELKKSKEFRKLGLEPLEKNFDFKKFKEILKNKRGKIKQVLMNQEIIVGIGNIYSDEILWEARINPFRDVSRLKEKELKKIFQEIKKILKKAIEVKGTSISDFRRISGKKGEFGPLRKVYQKKGEKCFRCGTIIERQKISGRSAHFCPKCQKK